MLNAQMYNGHISLARAVTRLDMRMIHIYAVYRWVDIHVHCTHVHVIHIYAVYRWVDIHVHMYM